MNTITGAFFHPAAANALTLLTELASCGGFASPSLNGMMGDLAQDPSGVLRRITEADYSPLASLHLFHDRIRPHLEASQDEQTRRFTRVLDEAALRAISVYSNEDAQGAETIVRDYFGTTAEMAKSGFGTVMLLLPDATLREITDLYQNLETVSHPDCVRTARIHKALELAEGSANEALAGIYYSVAVETLNTLRFDLRPTHHAGIALSFMKRGRVEEAFEAMALAVEDARSQGIPESERAHILMSLPGYIARAGLDSKKIQQLKSRLIVIADEVLDSKNKAKEVKAEIEKLFGP